MRIHMRGAGLCCIAVFVAALVPGCGQGTRVKKGDRFEVLEDMRTTANTEPDQPFTDGFSTVIPAGSVVEARFTTTPGASFFECAPVTVHGSTNPVAIMHFFVPDHIRTREGFTGFWFSLPIKQIGTKLKPIDGGNL